jgi:rhodanese-related sulfurtransferase
MTYDFPRAQAFFDAKVGFTTEYYELKGRLDGGEPLHVVDVRFPVDFRKAHIPGAVNFPMNQWEHPEKYLSKDRLNVLYCYNQACHKAAHAAAIAVSKGFRVIEMEGGFDGWQGAGFPVEESPAKAAA